MTFLARIRLVIVAVDAARDGRVRPGDRPEARPGWRTQSDRECYRASATLLKQVPRVEGRIDIPDTKGRRY